MKGRWQRRGAAGALYLSLLAVILGLPGPAVAQIAVANVSSVTFGLQPLFNTSASQVVRISNVGNDPTASGYVSIQSVMLVGSSSDFSIAADTVGSCDFPNLGGPPILAVLGPGGSCTITLTFTPSAAVSEEVVLEVASNGPIGPLPTLQIPVYGTGVKAVPNVTITPASLNFGDEPTDIPVTQYLTVTNTTTTAVNVLSATVDSTTNGASFSTTGGFCGTLSPGGECTVGVTFTPGSPGLKSADIVIDAQTNVQPPAVPKSATNFAPVSGTGTAPVAMISFSPETFNFGAEQVQATETATINVQNSGTANLRISSINLLGSSSAFSISNAPSTCVSATVVVVAPGSSCAIAVSFTPGQPGLFTGYININSNASNAIIGTMGTRIALMGTGVGATGQLTFTPSSLNFGLQPALTTSVTQTFFVLNTTSQTISLNPTSIGLGGNYQNSWVLTNYCKTPLAVGAECYLEVTFEPKQGLPSSPYKDLSTWITIAGMPKGPMISGTGITPTAGVTVTPTAISFSPSQAVGSVSAPQTLTVTNTSKQTGVRVSSITLGGPNSPSFFVSSNQCLGALAPGGSCTIGVEFAPQSVSASLTGAVAIGATAGGPQLVTLNGTGTEASLPSVGGMPLAQAMAALTAQGFEVSEVTTVPSVKTAPGDVIAETPSGASQNWGIPVSLKVSTGGSPIPALITERALAQAGLSIGLASNLAQSQSVIVEGLNNAIANCLPLGSAGSAGGAGSVQSQGTPGSVWVFSDLACHQPYIEASAVESPTTGEITETAIYFDVAPPFSEVGMLQLNFYATPTVSGSEVLTGSGSFTVQSTGQTVQLGYYCDPPAASSQSCVAGIVQDIFGHAFGALMPLDIGGLGFGGIGSSAYIGPTGTGSLILSDPNASPPAGITPPFMEITGSANSFESFSSYGAISSATLFPLPPTGWTVMDSSGDQIQISETSSGIYSLTMTVGASGASGTVNAAGNGSITYSDGTNATIANWILSN
jgi:hypothetical protein